MSLQNSGVLTSNSQNTQKIRSKLTFLEETLSAAGVKLSFNEEPHILIKEQSLVVRDAEKYFQNVDSSKAEEFIKEVKILCLKEKTFKKALLPTQLKKSGDGNETINSTIRVQQESLFRILLKVTCLQKEIIDILLEEITTVASEESQDTSWLRLLLNPLRYLPYIKDGKNLTTKLLDILDVAFFAAQLEILDSIPDIIPDNQHGQTAKELCKLLDGNEQLSGAIIDCLNALNLDTEMYGKVQDRILEKLLTGPSLKIFPILLQFLMTDSKSRNLVPTLIKIRNSLDTIMLTSEKNKEKESCKILIFNRLQTFARSPKTIAEGWLNMILSIKVHSDHKPIDYLILFMLHSTAKLKKRIIEGIFRKRVSSSLFKINLLEKMFEKSIPQQILKDYFTSIVEIGCSLLRHSNDPNVTAFASTLFKLLFNHDDTEVIYRKELLESLIVLTGASDKKTVSCVLKIISSLLNGSDKLQKHTVLLMKLLEQLDSLEFKDVKEVFEILCSLTCGENADESLSGLKDEIHIIVRKQLSSVKRNIKMRGIISAVVMAKHIALTSEDQSEISLTEESIVSITKLPPGVPREAASLLELTNMSTAGCPELIGLYYDQLATMLMKAEIFNKYFMSWLYENITNDFQNVFVTETFPESINDMPITLQYVLNRKDEVDSPMGINIAGLTAVGSTNNKLMLLAPHFRLLRLLHYRYNLQDLSSIDALLGCGVLLPHVDDITDLDSDQVKQVADCLFHCINWFREIVSGFVTQKPKRVRAKVVHRLQNLIDIEKLLQKCMELAPEHKLPVSYFDSVSQVNKQNTSPVKESKGKNPKKKFKSAPTISGAADETIASTAAPINSQKSVQAGNKKSTSATEHHISFREMDTDLICLIKYPIKFDDEDPSQFATQTVTLNTDHIKFIFKDFVTKLSVLTAGKDVGLSHLNVVVPVSIIIDCRHVLPNMDRHFQVIVKRIDKLLDQTDGRHDLPDMFTEEALELKTCFGLILECYCLVFSWTGFQHSSNLDILKNLLKSMRPEQSQTLNSANKLIIEFITKLSNYTKQCLDLNHAVSLIKTMQALNNVIVANVDVEKRIAATSAKLLSNRWYNSKGRLDAGKNCNSNIDILVKSYLCSANIQIICGLVGTLQEEAPLLKTKEDCLHMLASIDKQNFHVFYLGLCNALQSRVKTEIQTLTNNEHLVLWRTTALTMQGLMTIAKTHETRANLACFLKKSVGILKIFLSHGIPILEIMLRSKPDDVVAIFKSMQTSTRFLHHLCCHSRITKDASLMAYVPTFRLTLETLVYRVKAALAANNCSAAFWMGNLRNKDLHGEDILSQSTVMTDENENRQSDEELPSDIDNDEDIINNDNSENQSVESEVFD